MQIEYTGRHAHVTPDLRALAEKKLAKLDKVLRGITRVHVILAVDKHRHTAEVTVHSRNLDLAASEVAGDLETSLATVIDKLSRQAQKRMGKVKERKRSGPARPAVVWAAGEEPAQPAAGDGGNGGARVVRRRRYVVKPMTVDEAAVAVAASDDGLLIFRDPRTARLNVLFRRKDGNLGLIEPEP